MSKIEEIMTMKKEYEEKLKKYASEILKEEFIAYFDSNPEVVGITWDQYTPWFNDGEECKFYVHDFYLIVPEDEMFSGLVEDEIDNPKDWGKEENLVKVYCSSYGDGEKLKEVKEASALKKKIPKDVMLASFGDHVRIRATRKGFDVRECDHD